MDSEFSNMESLFSFKQEKADISVKEDPVANDSFVELDPNFELSLDIQDLINKANIATAITATGEQLFPELAEAGEDGKLLPEPGNVEEEEEEEPSIVLLDDGNSFTDIYTSILYQPPLSPDQTEETTQHSHEPKARAPSRTSHSSSGRRRRQATVGSNEYIEKRERNNIAVRKSRDKAKKKQEETHKKLQALSTHNEQLQKKVDLLTKELTVLKSLFVNVGAALPKNLDKLLDPKVTTMEN